MISTIILSRRVLGRTVSSRSGGTAITTRHLATSSSDPLSRYGLGGHNWKSFNPESYQELIRHALDHNVSHLEIAGQEGGEIAMVGALQSAFEKSPELAERPITITTRIGYRTLPVGDEAQKIIPGPGDVVMNEKEEDETIASMKPPQSTIVHNISRAFLEDYLQSTPLLELQKDLPNLHMVYLLHNPEVQVLELLQNKPDAPAEERSSFIQDRWTPALDTLQDYAIGQDPHQISFGVCSNGLAIPSSNNHPLYMPPDIVIQAANAYSRFSLVQLPANLLELYGWDVARQIKEKSPPSVSIAAMRPLTCYPDLGTGAGHPFRLVDYSFPTIEGDGSTVDHPYAPMGGESLKRDKATTMYTHEMKGVPSIYQIALQTTMSHFDADELLEAKQERDLSVEERETLDGCKLVSSMIHDLDAGLAQVRSFAAMEEELYGRIIPLLYDTFEAMDDHTSDVLQAYFAAYAVAVRYAIAKNTRHVLQDGEKGASSSTPKYPNIPSTMPLQEYALRKMLAEPCFDRIIVGASSLQDSLDLMEMISKISSTEGSPLNAIVQANEALDKENDKKEA